MEKPEFLIYRSSAGSGKTQTLAGEYLKLVLTNRADFRNVLAITFTNKAAEEMKERVLDLLQLFASQNPLAEHHNRLLNEIAAAGKIPVETVRLRAGNIHRGILHQYSEFNIGTIDSFVHRIIRSFALELNLSFSFEVQLETDSFITLAIDDLLERAGEDQELTINLVNFTRMLLEDEKSWNIDRLLADFSRFLTGETSMMPLEKLAMANIDIQAVAASNRSVMNALEQEWLSIIRRADDIVKACGVDPDHFSYGRSSGLGLFFENRLADLDFARIFSRYEIAKRMVGWMEEGKALYSKNTPADIAGKLSSLSQELIPVWAELTALTDKNYPEYATRELIAENLSNLSLSRKIREQMQITMDKENLIPIYEFNRLIWNIIRNQPVPFIYERTSERYNHFLIDEFQDTSSLQWLNLLPLIENSLAQGGLSMVVGDAKQAIYRWRNGDVWQFVRLPEISNPDENPQIRAREEALKRYAEPINLKHNYRSAKEIINFNNNFFSWLKSRFPSELNGIYESHDQLFGENAPEGYVEIHLVPENKEDKADDHDRLIADATLEKVEDILAQNRGSLKPSDICILVRKHKEAGIIASKLIEAGIDVVSGQSFTLKSFPEALFFRAVAGVLLDRRDAVSAAVIATQLYQSGRITVDEYHSSLSSISLITKEKGPIWPWVNELFTTAGVDRKMEHYLAMPLYEVCEHVIRDFYGGNATSAAVQYLLDIISSFIRSFGNDLSALTGYLDDKLGTSIPLPDTSHAVNIMTIHKAKGLQFKVVIYAFAQETTENNNNRMKMLWIEDADPDEYHGLPVLLLPFRDKLSITPFADRWEQEKSALFQDSVNVVYVALTRAAERLYVISAPKGKGLGKSQHFYRIFSEFLRESDLFQTDDDIIWRYGERRELVSSKRGSSEEGFRMPAWKSYPWHDRLGIRSGKLHSDYDDSREQAINRGVLMHTLLAEIVSSEEVESAVMSYVSSGLIRSDEAERLIEELVELTGIGEVKPFFDSSLPMRNEATLLTEGGKMLRPDRVVWMEDHVAVLDFKTGEPRASHHTQVNQYCDILRQMGHSVVKGYLLYLDSRSLVEV